MMYFESSSSIKHTLLRLLTLSLPVLRYLVCIRYRKPMQWHCGWCDVVSSSDAHLYLSSWILDQLEMWCGFSLSQKQCLTITDTSQLCTSSFGWQTSVFLYTSWSWDVYELFWLHFRCYINCRAELHVGKENCVFPIVKNCNFHRNAHTTFGTFQHEYW